MKKIKSLAICILCLGFVTLNIQTANSQAAIIALLIGDKAASETFNLSMEFGVNFSQFSNISDSKDNQSGINFGIAGNIKMSKNWYLSPNIYFLSQRSLKLNSFSPNSGDEELDLEFMNRDAELSMRYIDIPVFLSYQTNNNKFRFGIAPQISFLSKAEIEVFGDSGDLLYDIESSTNDLDYSILADFGYILGEAHKGRGVHLHLRYSYGLTDVFKDSFNSNENTINYFSFHVSLPFITDELAAKNLNTN